MTKAGERVSGPVNAHPLSIKSIIGGGLENKRWTAVIGELQLALWEMNDQASAPFNLTVTYFIPGEVYGPRFSGIRIGSFLEEFRSLGVQVALPEHPVTDARSEVLDLLDKAVCKAEAWGKRKKCLSGQLEEAKGVVASLRAGR